MSISALRRALACTAAYRNITDDPLMGLALELLDALDRQDADAAACRCSQLFYALHRTNCSSLGQWLHDRLRYDDSPYARLVELGGEDPALEWAARQDAAAFAQLAQLDLGRAAQTLEGCPPLPPWRTEVPFTFDTLTRFYRAHGSGIFARPRAFLWADGQLHPVAERDALRPEELCGYELQRSQVASNTRALLAGRRVNNVLLYGDSGTGKSATVKSLLHLPGCEELRLIEVEKPSLPDLPQLIRTLAGRRMKFILFIDDLAFDQDDATYSVMKTILEGGLERRPANVAVYATSNRRRLVRQTFSDRTGDEVDAGETIQEKTALSERFGLRIPYLALNKPEFLSLVEHLARRAGICLPIPQLHAQAIQWELRHGGRTPRTAQQFIASLNLPSSGAEAGL